MNVLQNLNVNKKNYNDSNIYQLIDMCKDLVRNNKVGEAKVFYNQIREKYYDVDFSSEREKEAVHNMIRALYDEINLADIGKNR